MISPGTAAQLMPRSVNWSLACWRHATWNREEMETNLRSSGAPHPALPGLAADSVHALDEAVARAHHVAGRELRRERAQHRELVPRAPAAAQ